MNGEKFEYCQKVREELIDKCFTKKDVLEFANFLKHDCEGHKAYFKENKATERKNTIKVYAQYYHYPISNFKEFLKVLKQDTGYRTTKKELIELLGY